MDHAPIYRSAENSRPAPLTSLVRGGSLVSAAVALTISGIALGYHGVAARATPGTDEPYQASIDMPVPMVMFPRVDGGHPDLIGAISSAIVHNLPPTSPTAYVAPVLPVFGPAFVIEAPPAFTDPVVVPIDILPVDDVATAIDDTVILDTAQLSTARANAPRTFAAAQVVVDVAGVQEEASAPAAEADPPAEAPAPAPAVAHPPTTLAAVRVSTPEPVRREVATPEPKPHAEEVKLVQVEAPKRTEPQKQEQPKDDEKGPATNQKGGGDGHGKKRG